jgi:hypothetical protein
VVLVADKQVLAEVQVQLQMELKLLNRKLHLFPRSVGNNLVLMDPQVEQIGIQVAVAVLAVTVLTLQQQVVLVVQIQFSEHLTFGLVAVAAQVGTVLLVAVEVAEEEVEVLRTEILLALRDLVD